ncbi:hypothetical protein Tco_0441539 [Tanacetum coccineum]
MISKTTILQRSVIIVQERQPQRRPSTVEDMKKETTTLEGIQFEVSSVGSITEKFLQTSHHPSFLQQLVDVFNHEMSSFLFQISPPSLWQFVGAHQPVPPDVVDIYESLRVFVWSVRVPFYEIRSCSIRLGDVDLFLITFNSKLKIFDSPLNNQTSGVHS